MFKCCRALWKLPALWRRCENSDHEEAAEHEGGRQIDPPTGRTLLTLISSFESTLSVVSKKLGCLRVCWQWQWRLLLCSGLLFFGWALLGMMSSPGCDPVHESRLAADEIPFLGPPRLLAVSERITAERKGAIATPPRSDLQVPDLPALHFVAVVCSNRTATDVAVHALNRLTLLLLQLRTQLPHPEIMGGQIKNQMAKADKA